jgi:tetratricopeptide (TPR) repeat protein
VALAAVMAFWVMMFAQVYPNTMTFFSAAAGGPSRGLDWLAESNLDWGQHLKQLKSWMTANNVEHVNLAYFGTADPKYYQIDCTHLPGAPFFARDLIRRPKLPGYVAISKTLLSGLYLKPEWRLFYAGLKQQAPVADIGNSINVYWVEKWPELPSSTDPENEAILADNLAFGLGWPEHAIVHYRNLLERNPGDAETTGKLAMALIEAGRPADTDESIRLFRRAAELDPESGDAHSRLAAVLLDFRRPHEALPYAREAVRLSPSDAFAHDLLGLALIGIGEHAAAESSFNQALAANPNYDAAREHIRILRGARLP